LFLDKRDVITKLHISNKINIVQVLSLRSTCHFKLGLIRDGSLKQVVFERGREKKFLPSGIERANVKIPTSVQMKIVF
jgi:hypothetical protein